MHHTVDTRIVKADELQPSTAPQHPRSQAMNSEHITPRNQTAMKHTSKLLSSVLCVVSALCLAATSVQGALIAHWKLDEANGDYTSGGIVEEVSGNATISTEVPVATSITEGQTGLSPYGGTSMSFSNTDPDSYISAGSVESNSTYVSGPATTPYVLGSTFTISGWFNASSITGGSSDRTIVSNQYTSNTGFALGTNSSRIFADFGNTREYSTSGSVSANRTYFVAMLQDTNGDTNFGWTAGSNNRISLYDTTTSTWQHFDGTDSKTGINLQNMSIGSFTSALTREFEGLLDDIRIYDNTLSQTELEELVVFIPEPSTAILAGLGLAGICLRRWRSA